MNSGKLNNNLKAWDEAIRQGKVKEVGEAIGRIDPRKVARESRQPLAQLCLRLGMYGFGLKILSGSVVDANGEILADAKQDEIAEYAILLQKIGLIDEAMDKLDAVDSKICPQALLYKAICHFSTWDYDRAEPYLQQYTRAADISPYQRLVGQVNLLSCLIHLKSANLAMELFKQIENICKENNYRMLLGNSYELLAQIQLQNGSLEEVEESLRLATSIFAEFSIRDQLYVLKWRAYLQSLRDGNIEELLKFQTQAMSRKHWESVREADLLILKVAWDEARFHRLLYGTPFAGYQKRLLSELGLDKQPRDHVIFGNAHGRILDVQRGTWGKEQFVDPGRKVHHLLFSLFSDLYKPMSLGSLFSRVFPEDKFNIYSSPNKVHQLVRRARELLAEYEVPVNIVHKGGHYEAQWRDELGLRLTLEKTPPARENLLLLPVAERWQGQLIEREELIKELDLPEATVGRIIRKASASGIIEKVGNGRGTKYRLHAA